MKCQPHFVGKLIGPNGATIKKLQRQTNTEINVCQNTVTITGTSKKYVELARQQVTALMSPSTCTLICPENKIGRLIGPSGSTIKRLQQETGTEIKVNGTNIVITGPSDVTYHCLDNYMIDIYCFLSLTYLFAIMSLDQCRAIKKTHYRSCYWSSSCHCILSRWSDRPSHWRWRRKYPKTSKKNTLSIWH